MLPGQDWTGLEGPRERMGAEPGLEVRTKQPRAPDCCLEAAPEPPRELLWLCFRRSRSGLARPRAGQGQHARESETGRRLRTGLVSPDPASLVQLLANRLRPNG